MYAAFKSSVMSYVRYDGITCKYPRWFTDIMLDHVYIDEFGQSMYNLDVLVEGWDHFVKNRFGDVRRYCEEDFEKYYTSVNNFKCVPHDAVLECYIWDNIDRKPPEWLLQAFQEGDIWKEHGTYWIIDYLTLDSVPMDPAWVVLRDSNGVLKYTPKYIFTEQFVTFENL